MLNEELAAHAISRALADRGLEPEPVRMLTTGTTQGDCLVPGFSSMVRLRDMPRTRHRQGERNGLLTLFG
jgi:hypothetical protein